MPSQNTDALENLAAQLATDGSEPPPDTPPEDKRLTGDRNELSALMWVYRFGWLSSRMLAALVWPTASQSWALARRMLKRLLADKLLLVRALPQGGDIYLLSVKGARLLQETAGGAEGGCVPGGSAAASQLQAAAQPVPLQAPRAQPASPSYAAGGHASPALVLRMGCLHPKRVLGLVIACLLQYPHIVCIGSWLIHNKHLHINPRAV